MQTCGADVSVKYVKSRGMYEVAVSKITDPDVNGVFYFESRFRAFGMRKKCIDEVLGLGRVFEDRHKSLPGRDKFIDMPRRSGARRYKRWSEI